MGAGSLVSSSAPNVVNQSGATGCGGRKDVRGVSVSWE